MTTGTIFNIQEYAVQDGAGIRTTVFFKGCPLRCKWCCNPEGQERNPEIMFNKSLKKTIGEKISAEKLYEKIKSNILFYKNSGGGVTLSGGEPFAQPEFANEFLKKCESVGISVGVETCGFFKWDKVKKFIDAFSFYYFDIKILDEKLHKNYTGKSNKLILKNLKNLAKNNAAKITLTITVVPGVNDSEKEMAKIAGLCKKLKIPNARLLPYHRFGAQKYEHLGRKYLMKTGVSVKNEDLEKFRKIMLSSGIKCKIE